MFLFQFLFHDTSVQGGATSTEIEKQNPNQNKVDVDRWISCCYHLCLYRDVTLMEIWSTSFLTCDISLRQRQVEKDDW